LLNLKNKFSRCREQRWYKFLVMALKLLLAGAIISIVIFRGGVQKEQFSDLAWGWLLAAFAVILLQHVLTGIRWWLLLRLIGIGTKLTEAVSLTLQGLFYTLFIPGGSVSGDVVKAALISSRAGEGNRFAAVFSVLIDRVCGLCGLLILSLIAAVTALACNLSSSQWFRHLLMMIVVVSPLGLLAALMAFRCDIVLKIRFLKACFDLLDRISRGGFSRIEAALAAYRPAWTSVLECVLLSGFVAFPLFALAAFLIGSACLAGEGAYLMNNIVGSLLSGSIGELAATLPLTPGGLGVRDAAYCEILKACSIPAAQAAVIPVVFSAIYVAASAVGIVFALHTILLAKSKKR